MCVLSVCVKEATNGKLSHISGCCCFSSCCCAHLLSFAFQLQQQQQHWLVRWSLLCCCCLQRAPSTLLPLEAFQSSRATSRVRTKIFLCAHSFILNSHNNNTEHRTQTTQRLSLYSSFAQNIESNLTKVTLNTHNTENTKQERRKKEARKKRKFCFCWNNKAAAATEAEADEKRVLCNQYSHSHNTHTTHTIRAHTKEKQTHTQH